MKAKQWMLLKHFSGVPKDDDMELQEIELPDELQPNDVLLEAVYLTVDPYMRPYSAHYPVPIVMMGESLNRVIKTRNGQFPLGSLVLANRGWRSHFISDGEDLRWISFDLGSTAGISASHCLGTLGMPGATAYFGLYKLCEPQAGEIVLVNGAAGAVGNVVGQLAKIRGCTVIAFVGDDEKLKWCKEELGFDHVFNYKKSDFSVEIAKVAPDGVDCFFDNVGGDFFHTVVNKHMKKYGRICCCGSIDNYNDATPKLYPAINFSVVGKELKIQGIIVNTFTKDWPIAFTEMNGYIKEGKLKLKETVYEGFGEMQNAFYGLFKGSNIGKAIVKA